MSPTAATDSEFIGSIPELYDRFLVPLIFEPYAQDLAARIAQMGPPRILEIAAGTGVLTRALASQLGMRSIVVATDLNVPMLEHAKKQEMPKGSRVQWQQADALNLPFESQSFDAVLCQFGVMFFPDRVRAYREARRVLKSDGLYLFNVWDRIEENDFANVITQSLETLFPDNPPQFLARTPHGHGDPDRIRHELTEAGFGDIEIEAVDAISRSDSPRHPAIAYCQGTPLRGEIEALGNPNLRHATEVAAEAMSKRYGAGPVEGRIRAFVISARN